MKAELQPKILFEDANLIVLDKPAGLLSQGEHTGDQNLVDWLREHFGRHYVGLVHRLDRNTSGVMVIAKRTKAAQRLTAALTRGALERIYLAWIHGTLRHESGTSNPLRWQHWLLKDETRNIVTAVPVGTPGAKEANLFVRPVRTVQLRALSEKLSLVTLAEFRLETGRSHQIRAQAAQEGHPLLGDLKYGGRSDVIRRPALHSWKIRFPHPIGGSLLEFETPLPPDLDLK